MALRMTPEERDEIIAQLKQWPLVPHHVIAKQYNRSILTIQRLGSAWGLGRRGK